MPFSAMQFCTSTNESFIFLKLKLFPDPFLIFIPDYSYRIYLQAPALHLYIPKKKQKEWKGREKKEERIRSSLYKTTFSIFLIF